MPYNSLEIAIKWSTDDVDNIIEAYEMIIKPELTKQEKFHILYMVKEHHDANIGINWDVLHTLILDNYGERIISEYYNA